jgi:hypothetical protein
VLGAVALSSGAVQSGHVASGAILGHNASGGKNIASGTIGTFDLGANIIVAQHFTIASVDANAIQPAALNATHFNNGIIGSGPVLSGAIGWVQLASGAARSGNIASGQVGGAAYADGSVQSGAIGSGQVSRLHLASGLYDFSMFTTAEEVSGFCVVTLDAADQVIVAHPGSGLRMPVLGIVASNFANGVAHCPVITNGGPIYPTTGTLAAAWSGFRRVSLFCGSGGRVVTFSGLASGDSYQRIGYSVSGGIVIRVDNIVTSGAMTANGVVY